MLVWGVHTWGWPSAGPIKSTNKAIPGYTLCPITQRCGDKKYNLRDIFCKYFLYENNWYQKIAAVIECDFQQQSSGKYMTHIMSIASYI